MLRQYIVLLLLLLYLSQICNGQCGKEDFKRCVMLADPLLKDPQLIYPNTMHDIINVCRSWDKFAECVKRYTDSCFTENKLREFNKAVESPVDLVHKMCTRQDYQIEYLKHAVCMKAVLTDDSHCGRHYRHLVSQVSGEPATPALCCSHFRFRECLIDQTRKTCNSDALKFAKETLEKAMGFLQEQCSSYRPDQANCPGSEFYANSGNRNTPTWTDPATGRMTPDISSSWPMEHKTTMRKYDWMTNTWKTTNQEIPDNSESTRTGYSRGMSWGPSSDMPIKTVETTHTDSVWPAASKDTTISPMAIDEPNQAGLFNGNNGASVVLTSQIVYTLFLILTFTVN